MKCNSEILKLQLMQLTFMKNECTLKVYMVLRMAQRGEHEEKEYNNICVDNHADVLDGDRRNKGLRGRTAGK